MTRNKKFSKWISIAYKAESRDILHDSSAIAIKNGMKITGGGKPGIQAWYHIRLWGTDEQMQKTIAEWNGKGANVSKRKPSCCFAMPEMQKSNWISSIKELDDMCKQDENPRQ